MGNNDHRMIALHSRMTLFNLLARAFNYPDEVLADRLRSGALTADLHGALAPLNLTTALARDIEALEEAYIGPDKAEVAALLLDLERDYTRLFFASKPRLAYLFESVYNEGRLLQESTFQIARLYYDAGLKLGDDFKLPPDHIAVEFEFMAYLYFNEIEAIQKADEKNEVYARQLRQEVIEKHLGAFGGTLAEKVATHARTVFYRSMARVARVLLAGYETGAAPA